MKYKSNNNVVYSCKYKDVKWDFIRYSTDNDVLKVTDYISDPHLQISFTLYQGDDNFEKGI